LALEYVTGLDGVSVSLIGVSRLDQLNSLLSDLHDFNAPKPGIPRAEN
jgi:hypothetical protein